MKVKTYKYGAYQLKRKDPNYNFLSILSQNVSMFEPGVLYTHLIITFELFLIYNSHETH